MTPGGPPPSRGGPLFLHNTWNALAHALKNLPSRYLRLDLAHSTINGPVKKIIQFLRKKQLMRLKKNTAAGLSNLAPLGLDGDFVAETVVAFRYAKPRLFRGEAVNLFAWGLFV
jgi:hypothetical protein